MLNINGDFYDFYEYKGEENLDKNPLEFFMNYHGGIKNGATFSIFSLDLEEKEILDMKNHLEYFVTHEDELPEYWASSNNCSDFLSENILNTFGDFNLSTKGITTPNIIAKQLFKHKKVNGIYGGYVKDSVFHTVKTSPSNIYTKHLQLVTDARDKDFLSY